MKKEKVKLLNESDGKAIGATWSWWWLIATVILDYNFNDQPVIRIKRSNENP